MPKLQSLMANSPQIGTAEDVNPTTNPANVNYEARPSMERYVRDITGGSDQDRVINDALVRVKTLLAFDRGQGPRPDVPARGYYLNIKI